MVGWLRLSARGGGARVDGAQQLHELPEQHHRPGTGLTGAGHPWGRRHTELPLVWPVDCAVTEGSEAGGQGAR